MKNAELRIKNKGPAELPAIPGVAGFRCMRSFAVLMCGLAAISPASALNIPLPPYTIYGEVQNIYGVAFSSNDNAVVIAEIDGEEMDRCNVISGIYPGANYRLRIPIASTPREGYAEKGDLITFNVSYGNQLHAVASKTIGASVGSPGAANRIQLAVGTDSDSDGFVDEYEQLLSPYYQNAGQSGALEDISPDDDFDHDGFSNYEEFIAGTIPVDGSDLLVIREFYQTGSNTFALAFLSAPGRSYALPQAADLTTNQWEYARFSQSSNAAPTKYFLFSEQDQYTTLFLQPSTNNAMIRLEVQ